MISKYYKDFRVRDYMENELLSNELTGKMIDCSLGTNPFIDESFIQKHVAKGSCELNKYLTSGYENLKEELIKYWKKYLQPGVDVNNISFGAGTMGILRNISQFMINEGTYILGYSPQFPRFISEVELKKGIYEYYALEEKNNYKFIADDFISMINSKYSMIYIDNPNNPTGQIIDLADIEKIVQKSSKFDITVVIDECYGDYMSQENSAINLVKKYENLVVIKSASKFFGLPNHRIGYLFADESFIKVYNEITIPFPFSDLSANIFVSILKDQNNLLQTKTKVIETNKMIYQALKKEDFLYTSVETPIFTIRSDKYDDLTDTLMKKSVISENCCTFLNLSNKFTRIRIAKDSEKLLKILLQVL